MPKNKSTLQRIVITIVCLLMPTFSMLAQDVGNQDSAPVVKKTSSKTSKVKPEKKPKPKKTVAKRTSSKAKVEKEEVNPLYPYTKSEIKEKLAEFASIRAEGDVSTEEQKALNVLNSYRYLCGTYFDCKIDPVFKERAVSAANTCASYNKMAHDLGGFTELCNLSIQEKNYVDAVHAFIYSKYNLDKKTMFHRGQCLKNELHETGFGKNGTYIAMCVNRPDSDVEYEGGRYDDLEGVGPEIKEDETRQMQSSYGAFSYPGRGFFPTAWFRGDAWSYYPKPDQECPAEGTQVELWQLKSRPKEEISEEKLPKLGRQIKLKEVYFHDWCVVFYPDLKKVKGIYWVRICAPEFIDEYVVEFY